MYCYLPVQGRSQGGPGVPVTLPFCKPILSKQSTTGGEQRALVYQRTEHGVMTLSWLSNFYFEILTNLSQIKHSL